MPSWIGECEYRATILLRQIAPWFSTVFGLEDFPVFRDKNSLGWEMGDPSNGCVLQAKGFGLSLCVDKPHFNSTRFSNYPLGHFTFHIWFSFPGEEEGLYFDYKAPMDSDLKVVCGSITRLIQDIERALFEKVLKHPSQWSYLRNTRLYNKYKKFFDKNPWEIANHLVQKRTGLSPRDLTLHAMSLLFTRDGYL
jgi:hypothetical protein